MTACFYSTATLTRDIADQGLISCLHDQPRSGTFTTGDLLFVYTQYDENQEHIFMDWYSFSWYKFMWLANNNNAFIWNEGHVCYTVRYCVIHERKFIMQQLLSTVNESEQKKTMYYFARRKNGSYGVHVLTVDHHDYSNISARRWARAAHSSTKHWPSATCRFACIRKDSQYTGLTLHNF